MYSLCDKLKSIMWDGVYRGEGVKKMQKPKMILFDYGQTLVDDYGDINVPYIQIQNWRELIDMLR